MVLKRFESMRMIKNKEWLFDIDIKSIIKNTRTILHVMNIKYVEEDSINEYNDEINQELNFC